MKILLFQTSDTQRVTITKNEDGSWLLSKEWRHNNQEPWILGKGVLLPKQQVKAIGKSRIGIYKDGTEFVVTLWR